MAPQLHSEHSSALFPNEPIPEANTFYTSQEVLSHGTPEDCWLIIYGKVYDVTSWIPHHPGGTIIYVNAGQDSSQLFESYHPLYVRNMLERYCIGSLKQDKDSELVSLHYEQAGKEEFHLTLKKRVETYFKKMKVNPRVHPHMFFKSIAILATYLFSYYLTFYWEGSFALSILSAVATGFLVAEIAVCIQHDANHGSFSDWLGLGYLMGLTMDLIGASSFVWKQQHLVGHHAYTNVNGYDPDIRVNDPDVRRVTIEHPRRNYHYFQHWYMGCLYGLLALKSVFLDDFQAIKSGSIGPIKVSKMTSLEKFIFWGGKSFYVLYMLVLPAIFSCHSGARVAILYITSQLIAGWTLAFWFEVAHLGGPALFPIVEKSNGVSKVSKGWAEIQVRATNNFCAESTFWTYISGGLNLQIEHHLFPGICHLHYPSIQPIVKETCKEFNIPYSNFPTFWSALQAHFEHLKKAGRSDFKLRLDG